MDEHSIDSFIPMQYKEVNRNERIEKKLVPAIHNLIFVKSSRELIDTIKSKVFPDTLRYIMSIDDKKPMIIPEKQMLNFIAVAGSFEEQVLYLPADDPNLKSGDKVRIMGGVFAGVEGVFKRIKRGTRVVVVINGLMAVATTSIHPSLIEKIN